MTTWTRTGDTRNTRRYEAEIGGVTMTVVGRDNGTWDVEDVANVLRCGITSLAEAKRVAEEVAGVEVQDEPEPEADTLTSEQIEALRIDAGTHGDTKLVETCRRAEEGDEAARATVARILAAAETAR